MTNILSMLAIFVYGNFACLGDNSFVFSNVYAVCLRSARASNIRRKCHVIKDDYTKDTFPSLILLHCRLAKLHQFTPYHNYLIKSETVWTEFGEICFKTGSRYNCLSCEKKICIKCFAVRIPDNDDGKLYGRRSGYICKDCFILEEYKYIYNLIRLVFDAVFYDKSKAMEINIISIIANFGCLYQCRNCQEIFNFDAQFEKKIICNVASNEIDLECIKEYKSKRKNIACAWGNCVEQPTVTLFDDYDSSD